jgi:rhodanese-related sulfurtransferase
MPHHDSAGESKTVQQMLAEARTRVTEVSATDAKQARDRGEVDLILDVREAWEWERGHIAGAVHAPLDTLEQDADPTAGRPEITGKLRGRVVVNCASGQRSLLAADLLKKMGYQNVVSMAGGFNDWKAKGFPVE